MTDEEMRHHAIRAFAIALVIAMFILVPCIIYTITVGETTTKAEKETEVIVVEEENYEIDSQDILDIGYPVTTVIIGVIFIILL